MPQSVTATIQIGTYNPATDVFTSVLDLNDYTNIWQLNGSPKIGQPHKNAQRAGNPRTDGERITNTVYGNRMLNMTMHFGKAASYTTIRALVTTFVSTVEGGGFVLRYAPPSPNVSVNYSYFDVLMVTHDADDFDPKRIINGTMRVKAVFECAPFIRGDRVWCQNLVNNPGFEQPLGGGNAANTLTAFTDNFANVSSYVVSAGSAPTVSSSVMTLVTGARVLFGSPAWGALSLWQIRWKWVTGLTATFYLHFTDASNYIKVTATNGTFSLIHNVAGTPTTIQTTAPTLVNTNFYWLKFVQFPINQSAAPYLTANLFNDSAGAVGTAVGSGALAGSAASGSVAVIGKAGLEASGASLAVGGAFSSVNTATLFGPSGWRTSLQAGSANAFSSVAWEGDRTEFGMATLTSAGDKTTPNGPVMSHGSMRIDLAPAGTVDVEVRAYTGGSPAGTQAIAIRTAGDIIRVAAHSIASGLGANATRKISIREYDSSGTLLRTDANWHGTAATQPTLTGNTASWPTYNNPNLADFYTTGTSCAYVDISLRVTDTNSAASANGIVIFDNIQIWNQTRTGMSTMDYHELRFPNSPAQLLITGIAGEVPAPCAIHWNTFQTVSAGAIQSFWIGLRALSASYYGRLFTTVTAYTPALDTAAFGGFVQSATMGATTQDIGFNWTQLASYLLGVFRILLRLKTTQTGTATSGNIALTSIQNGLSEASGSGLANNVKGRVISPAFVASATYGVQDAGLMTIPGAPIGAFADVTGFTTYQIATVTDPTNAGIVITSNYLALMPADDNGTLVTGQITYPSGSSNLTSQVFLDGLNAQLQREDVAVSATLYTSTTYASENHPEYGVSGPGISGTTGQYGVSLGQDSIPYLTPSITLVNGSQVTSDVNQGVAIVTDASGAVLPFLADIVYTPLYLYPRS